MKGAQLQHTLNRNFGVVGGATEITAGSRPTEIRMKVGGRKIAKGVRLKFCYWSA